GSQIHRSGEPKLRRVRRPVSVDGYLERFGDWFESGIDRRLHWYLHLRNATDELPQFQPSLTRRRLEVGGCKKGQADPRGRIETRGLGIWLECLEARQH